MTWGSRSDGAREGMNMGKEKIEEKDVRLLRHAVEQAFDGAMRDGALTLLNRLVDSASEAANLEEELLNLKGEYQRSMENSKRGAFKRLHAAYKRKCRREKLMAKGQMLCADGKPVMFGESLSAAGLWRTRSCLRAWMRRSGRQSSLLWVRSSWWSACGASTLRVWSTTTRWKSAATATRGKHQQTITAIGRSSVGKGARASGRVPFFFGFFGTALRAA